MIYENSNRSIAINSIVMYVRLAIVSVCGLLYTRFGLQALGAEDYGLYAVVGGIVALMAIANSIMISVSNRYTAVAIAKGQVEDINRTFNVNLIIHITIALLMLLTALPIAHWYISHYVQYAGEMRIVYTICDIAIVASAISFIGVPYNGLLLAKERFFVYCSTDVGAALLKLVVTYLLIDHWENKLLIYALTMAVMTAYPTSVFIRYCRRHFGEMVRFRLVCDHRAYRDVLCFATGVGIGTLVGMIKIQGTQLLINAFFGTLLNSAIAVANTVNSLIQMFAQNISKAIAPQIYKSYAAQDKQRYTYLVCLSSRFTYLVMLAVALPFLLIPETLFGIWLKDIPEGTITFSRLMIIDILIVSLNAGIVDVILASGRIYLYQIVVNTLLALSIVLGGCALWLEMPAQYLFYSYIVFSALIFFIRPIIMLRVVKFDVRTLVRESYLPVLIVTALTVPAWLCREWLNPWLYILMAMLWYGILVWLIGLQRKERQKLIQFLHDKATGK